MLSFMIRRTSPLALEFEIGFFNPRGQRKYNPVPGLAVAFHIRRGISIDIGEVGKRPLVRSAISSDRLAIDRRVRTDEHGLEVFFCGGLVSFVIFRQEHNLVKENRSQAGTLLEETRIDTLEVMWEIIHMISEADPEKFVILDNIPLSIAINVQLWKLLITTNEYIVF